MFSSFQQACARNDWLAVKQMIEGGASPDGGSGWPPICLCALKGAHRTALVLAANLCNVNRRTPAGLSAMEISAYEGHLDIMRLLYGCGARFSGEELLLAAKFGREEVVSFLLEVGPLREAPTALVRAAWRGHAPVVGHLLQAGVVPEEKALVGAAAGGHTRTCKLLVRGGATLTKVCLILAEGRGHEETARYLRRKGRPCAQCRALGPWKKCAACREVYYCSKECQKVHWQTHKASCVSTID